MCVADNNEQPHGPNTEIKSKRRDLFLSKVLNWVTIVIVILTVCCTVAIVKESTYMSSRLDRQSQMIVELENAIHILTKQLSARADQQLRKSEDGIIRRLEKQSQMMNDLKSRLAEKRQLIHVPFNLLTGAEESHALMTNGGIMHDEYTKFIQSRQNNMIASNVAAFTHCNPNALVFNLWYLNRKLNVRFDSIYTANMIDAIMESAKTTIPCEYKLIQDNRSWDNATALGEYTAVYNFDTWYDRRATPGVNYPTGAVTIMEVC